VDGLERLSAPDLAAAADACLGGAVGPPGFEAAFVAATAAQAVEVDRTVAERRVREAFTWEEPRVRHAFDLLSRTAGWPRDRRRAYLERTFARVWQRYCSVNASIGSWGPFLWITLDPARPATEAAGGPTLLGQRRVFLEPWAVATYAARLAGDLALRRWMPPAPRSHHLLDGLAVRRPGGSAVTLTREEAAAMSLCDGRRPGVLVANEMAARGIVASGDVAAAIQLLEGLVARGLLEWDQNLPVVVRTEEILDDRIAAIGDPLLRSVARDGLDRLRSARDAVAGAAGDPEALAAALGGLRAAFAEATGHDGRRGRYSGNVCVEEATLNAEFTLGHALLEDIAPALAIVLQAARWLTADFARRFEAVLADLVSSADEIDRPPRLSDIWDSAADLLLAPRACGPLAEALSEFELRWRGLLSLDDSSPRLTTTSSALREQASDVFAAGSPGWAMAHMHSPDLLICAESVQAVNAGRYLVVLGELHIAYATFGDRSNAWVLPDPDRFVDLTVEDMRGPRLIPLMPSAWSKYAGRSLQFEEAAADYHIGFARATGVASDRVIPTCGVTIERTAGRLVGRLPNGTLVPLIEFFGAFLSMCSTNAIREVLRRSHTPRVTVDRLVVWRESWRLTAEEVEMLALPDDEMAAYLAGRRLAAKLRLPAECFARLSSDRKPIYVNFTSPLFVSVLCAAIRSGRRRNGGLQVTLTEMLPATDDAWLCDARGNRYINEIRLHVVDSESVRGLHCRE
jgi:hypothetical protein